MIPSGFNWILIGSIGGSYDFHRASQDFIGFHRLSIGFPIGFSQDTTRFQQDFHRMLIGSHRISIGCS